MTSVSKSLLWLLLIAGLAGNVFLNFAVEDGPLQIVLGALCGVCALGAIAGLVVRHRAR
ncbi:hypothetical protein OG204_05820 [Streptomyces sp. NBC_01387]|uniref:hypothetical protein n=1 Tax=unclassified Streptomyces TaxID=2593676 RepID=UPI0020248375|nr:MULTISPECIES: hypothetical protein [unclassified Streptomyces]MCX4552186.1 hypothetical protein [Streptomyces sp. NBC_01500]WSC23565.1 hypothetical protein OIE60_30030 [Streptomyces sp. NBC_01766]WSV57438.1 hypothetical protein OG282_29230 [Streptomyces sp. NBC_01014]